MKKQNKDRFSLGVKHQVFNNEVRSRRLRLGMTQKQLGELVGLGVAAISHIESFRNYPSGKRADKIAKVLGTTVDKLFPQWLAEYRDIKPVTTIHELDVSRLGSKQAKLLVGSQDVLLNAEKEELGEVIVPSILNSLNPRERKIIELRFGLSGLDPKTYEELGRVFGITRERTRQIERRALKKLKLKSRSTKLKAYLQG